MTIKSSGVIFLKYRIVHIAYNTFSYLWPSENIAGMKKKYFIIIPGVLLLLTFSNAYSQSAKVPPFQMTLHDGKPFKAQNLPPGKHIIIVYFSPECEDCHEFTTAMLEHINDFQNSSIAMITYMPVDKVKPYVAENKLDKYPNIYVGTEGNSLYVANYYNITKFPFVALYDKNGNLIKKYTSKEINLEDLINRLKQL